MNSSIYHEKQSSWKCGIHAVNNLLQSKCYTQRDFDDIAKRLYDEENESKNSSNIINPYKNILGLGNYDITVIESALIEQGCYLIWWDMRRDIDEINFKEQNLLGFIINDRGEKSFFSNLFKWAQTNHWYTIRKIGDYFYDLDSRNDYYNMFESTEKVKQLFKYIKKNDGFIFLVFTS